MAQYDEFLIFLKHKDNEQKKKLDKRLDSVIREKEKEKDAFESEMHKKIDDATTTLKALDKAVKDKKVKKNNASVELDTARALINDKDSLVSQYLIEVEEQDSIHKNLISEMQITNEQIVSLQNEISDAANMEGENLKLQESLNKNTAAIKESFKYWLITCIIAIGILTYLIVDYPSKNLVKVVNNEVVVNSNNARYKMIKVKGGKFYMGDNKGKANQRPQRLVDLDSYSIGETEVTFALYDAYCEDTGVKKPSDNGWGRGNRPVINVSWTDANKFCQWLSEKTGDNYRLPTEAEWEFAAMGGQYKRKYSYSGSEKIGDVAWYKNNGDNRTHPVKSKKCNGLGIYDMSGNVWEWCNDWYGVYTSYNQNYGVGCDDVNVFWFAADGPSKINLINPRGPKSGKYRVARGGSWSSSLSTAFCKIMSRGYNKKQHSSADIGFRIVKDEYPEGVEL